MRAASIELRAVTKSYGDVRAVDRISFAIAAGRLVTLLGPSGCGKTTTLRLIAGLELPSAGAILIGGRDVTQAPAAERDVTMVFQSYALFPHMSVLENVRYGLVVSRIQRARADERARAALAGVGLSGYDERLPSELSGGQQQRVALARALVLEPSVLLFDEPLSNLDARLRRQMREEIRELQQRLSLTVVYVTHDQAEAMAVSDRIIVMNRATIAQEGAPRELYEQPHDSFVAGFMGDANRVRGVLSHRNGTRGDVTLGALTLSLPHRGLADGDVELSIRPEAITLRPPGATPLSGTIRKAAYLGGSIEYTLDTGIGELFAVSMAVEHPYAVGDGVAVELAQHGVVLVPPAAPGNGH
ncbi:MAG TPA: ABC transporter ATP-binding protein [Casimicrobiaceae bacterium]